VLSKIIYTKDFAVATEHYYSSLAAFEVLKKGGNAFDATVAASFALTVLQPHLNGLGGDFFALVYSSEEDKIYCLNSSGWYYRRVSLEKLIERNFSSMPTQGAFSAVIPGYAKGICSLHERFSSLKLKDLIEYSIKYAEHGFPISEGLESAIKINSEYLAQCGFLDSSKFVGGRLLKQPELANTLKQIANEGPNAFYEGKVAKCIVDELLKRGVEADLDDFKEFKEEWVEPLSIEYKGYKIYEVPPNSMGATTLSILKIIEEMDLSRFSPASERRIYEMLKAFIASYSATENYLGDPKFVKFNFEEYLKLGKKNYSELKIPIINNLGKGDTTYFSIVDSKGNIVSAIQSLFHHFGSKIYIKDCGFFLNNRASAFKFSGPNKLEPRKRPLHTLSSLILEKDRPRIAIGTSGGYFRPQQHSQFVTNIVNYGMKLNEAIDFPRFLWNGGKNLIVEEGFSDLQSLGFLLSLQKYPGKTGVAQAVVYEDNYRVAVCDVRGDGIPLGE